MVLIFAQKGLRDGTGIAERGHGPGGNGAVRAFLVHYDADDLDVIRRPELLEYLFAVGHLRHGLWRDEAHGVDVFETGPDERAQVLDLNFGRNLPLEALPGVARAFDELYGIVWHV